MTKLYNKYKEENGEDIDIEGTIEYLEDLDIDPEQYEALLLSWYLNSESTGQFQKKQFLDKWSENKIYDLAAMRKKINQLSDDTMNDGELFDKIYNWTFGFLAEPNQKKLTKEDAVQNWKLLFDKKYSDSGDWLEYIDKNWSDGISRDNWYMTNEFMKEYKKEDYKLSEHDESGAWPSIIDGFVEYLNEK